MILLSVRGISTGWQLSWPLAVLGAVVYTSTMCGFSAAAQDEDSLEKDYAAELPRIPPVEPGEVLATFEVHPDFEMQLAAAEPLVRDPIAIAFDEAGRAYVVGMRGYSEERDENLSEVRLLEDTNGDGVFDKSTAFLESLTWPTAVACYKGGVFVGVPPDMLYCKDTDGDGKSDIQEVVFTGFGINNVQGMMNTLTWGLDNLIHGAGSSNGGEVRRVDDPNAPMVSISGRDFAFDPVTRAFFAESGGLQHGLSFDVWGRKFLCHNSDNCQLVLFEDRYVARNPYLAAPAPRKSIAADGPAADVFRISPVEPWREVRTRLRVKGLVPGPIEGGGTAAGYFTSATGITVYKGDAWPESYYGNLFIGDVGSNLIHRKFVIPDGVSLIADRADPGTEFVRSKDIWFRPVQFCNGPDGNLYVCDMYREVIEHPLSLPPIIKKHLDLTSGRDRGRIYRIAPKGYAHRPVPNLGQYETEDLVPLLESRNAWHYETAMRLIFERQDKSAVPALVALAKKSSRPEARMRALYALAGLGALAEDVAAEATEDLDARVRVHAVRFCEPFLEETGPAYRRVTAMHVDPDPNVRYQVAFSLGFVAGAKRSEALAEIAKRDGADPLFRLAILSSVARGPGRLFAILLEDEAYRARDDGRVFLVELARQLGALEVESELGAAFARIERIPEAEVALANALIPSLLDGMKDSGRASLAQTVLGENPKAKALLQAAIEGAREVAANTDAATSERVRAIQTLGFDLFDNVRGVLAPLIDQREPGEVQLAALACLRRFDHPEVPALVLNAWDGLSPRLREEAIEALLARRPWTAALLDEIEAGRFKPGQIDSVRASALRNHADAAIRERALKLLSDVARGSRQEIVEAYREALTRPGDPQRGKAIFTEQCAKCHKVGGTGFEVGPDLATVVQAGPEKILVNVLDPNREINPQYVNYVVETDDFESHSGIIVAETATSITLKRANGETDTVLRVNIESIRTDNLSIMPEGLEQGIDHQDMADLIAFLTSANQG